MAHRIAPPTVVPEDVVEVFERLAFNVIERGFEHYSARALLHRIRWHYRIEKGERDFKCNNNWTARLARWFMAEHPQHAGFFITRESSPHDMTDLGED